MTALLRPRTRPCSSCPYRKDVQSGIWAASEYEKLPGYDGDTPEQAEAGAFHLFQCHQQPEHLCAGWVGCHDMWKNLAVRLNWRRVSRSVYDYVSPVPLFGSGAEAAEHGKRDIEEPSLEARHKVEGLLRLTRLREARQRKEQEGQDHDQAGVPGAEE